MSAGLKLVTLGLVTIIIEFVSEIQTTLTILSIDIPIPAVMLGIGLGMIADFRTGSTVTMWLLDQIPIK